MLDGKGIVKEIITMPIYETVIEVSSKSGSDYDKPKRENLLVVSPPGEQRSLVGFFLGTGSRFKYPVMVKADIFHEDRNEDRLFTMVEPAVDGVVVWQGQCE